MKPFILEATNKGLVSRKFLLAIGMAIIIVGGCIVAGLWPGFGEYYSTLIGGLLGLYGAYVGSNVVSGWVTGRANTEILRNAGRDASADLRTERGLDEVNPIGE